MTSIQNASKRATPLALSLMLLVTTAFAYPPFNSGAEVGEYCNSRYTPGTEGYNGCIDAGCASMHTTGSDGYDDCMRKARRKATATDPVAD